jgi:hypothetical protein
MKTCSICGKEFDPPLHYMYKRKVKKRVYYQCSYNCYRKAGGDDGKYNRTKLPQTDIHLQEMREEVKD